MEWMPGQLVFLWKALAVVFVWEIIGSAFKALGTSRGPACESCSWWLEGRREHRLGICRLEISLGDAALKGRRPTTRAGEFCQRYERWGRR